MSWRVLPDRRMALGLILAAAFGALGGTLVGAPTPASGETGGPPNNAGTPSTGTSTTSCPSPNQLTLVAGTPQAAALQTAFASGLQVALTNSNGCPVTSALAGIPVTFSAPSSGPSGVFSGSGASTVTAGADSSGAVTAPTFTANDIAGGYTVSAGSQYGSVSFSLANTAAGIPARLTAIPPSRRSASVGRRYPEPLQVRVLDAGGNPVPGAAVTFTLGSASAGVCGASATAGASFAGGGTTATATTSANGLVTSPPFTADTAAGSFAATASVSGSGGSGTEGAGKAADPSLAPASFSLLNLAGKPANVVPGIGATQSTEAGSAFPIPLAVTVTDSYKNPVQGALVSFSAPAADSRFTIPPPGPHRHRGRVAHAHAVNVRTGVCGIAVAPTFTASDRPGGYVVEARARLAKPAAFALVNEAP